MTCRETLHTIVFHYSQFYFVTLAITLGSGILGLPTTLADSGFLPFLSMIFASYIVQAFTIIFMTEVLQRAYYRNIKIMQTASKEGALLHLQLDQVTKYGLYENTAAAASDEIKLIKRCLPNLHSLGELYLPYFLPFVSTFIIFVTLAVFLVSYTLAGSQTYAALIGTSFYYVVPIFSWALTAVVILLHPIISPIISVLTIFKVLLITVSIILTFVAGVQHQSSMVNDFTATGDSFQMSLVSLAGFVIAMPLMFARAKQTKNGLIGYIVSIFLGLTTCLILNILWCWSILAVVPQHSICLLNNKTESTSISWTDFNTTQIECILSPSLKNAEANGAIAPIPLSMVLENEENPLSPYLSIIIQVFVATSITVSFITVGSVLIHTLNGIVNSFWSSPMTSKQKYEGMFKSITIQLLRQWFLALIIFLLIFAIAFCNPRSFNTFVQKAGSPLISIQIGILLEMMIYKASYSWEFRSCDLPLQLPKWILPFQILIPIYYIFAIIYNIYRSIVDFQFNI